jgi:hypothetical protein
MGTAGTGKFRLSSRLWTLVIPLVSLLAISVCWNLRQSQLIANERERSLAVLKSKEAARARKEAEEAEAQTKRKAKWAASDARLQELYREIDSLSHINEQVLTRPLASPKKTVTINNPAETLSAP